MYRWSFANVVLVVGVDVKEDDSLGTFYYRRMLISCHLSNIIGFTSIWGWFDCFGFCFALIFGKMKRCDSKNSWLFNVVVYERVLSPTHKILIATATPLFLLHLGKHFED